MSEWADVLRDFDVRTLAPRGAGGASHGYATPGEALDAAGGVPSTAPDTPLLVAVNDPDRATRSGPAVAATRAAAPERALRIVVATGTHTHDDDRRRRHEEPLRAAAGPNAEIRWHAGEEADQVPIGDECGDPWLRDARDVVAVGEVEPHWFAGLSGSYKTLSVGLMGRGGIARSHRLALEPGARPLALDDNPVHQAILGTLRTLLAGRSAVALDLLNGRWSGGDPSTNVRALLPAARARWGLHVPAPLDFLVARIPPPLDGTLYQAEKGVKNNEHAVRDGGAIVLDAACERGVGPRRFMDLLMRASDEASARALIEDGGYRLGDHKAVRLRALQARGVAIGVVAPTFPREAARIAGIRILTDRDEASAFVRETVGDGAAGVVLPDGGYTVVEVRA